MPIVIKSVPKRYPIWLSGRRNCSAMSRMVAYPMRKIELRNQFEVRSLKYEGRSFQNENMIPKRRIPSKSISKSGLGKWETPFTTTANGQLYGENPRSSWFIELPIRPSPSATGMITARTSVIAKKEYFFSLAKANTAIRTPRNPPWKLIPPFQKANISLGWARKYHGL